MQSKVISFQYTCYGASAKPGNIYVLGFTGAPRDIWTGCYLLGNGKRTYNPNLMRFLSPDSLSPFSKGGINAYAYCSADPINRLDHSGQNWITKLLSRPEPKYTMTEIIAIHDHPDLQKYSGWRFSNKATGWDVKMAKKLPKRLAEKAQLERDIPEAAQHLSHNILPKLVKRSQYLTAKIEATVSRLTELQSGLTLHELAAALAQNPGLPPPPYSETSPDSLGLPNSFFQARNTIRRAGSSPQATPDSRAYTSNQNNDS
ncbi:TPA: RHS repeat-associated core domain-containing protein [Pseudomonas putida]|uniref:RHS repeat-associated core domain-containing protein n=1 Tax=Pseudomonas putida TaxID=303 RepID=UPI0023648F00|nr:RHS repeat-associated core domain-containing protein [Pseudomonas putida]MDD2011171.1 RHS repeat-associated core domain-containing protein [Pseudomonas putida]HDS1777772.1 RHS repeat-associated core domain-containing protein [Pseudomonas putida]